MRKSIISLLKSLALVILMTLSSSSSKGQQYNDSTFCVFELFTSEGCSSCPYADNMLNNAVYAVENTSHNRLYIALHIEYWNYLGWYDMYSDDQYDDMFFDYYNGGNGITFSGSNQFATPMFVRNGEEGMNYSTSIQYKTATAFVDMNFADYDYNNNVLTIDYELSGDLTNAIARFFLVEGDLSTNVTSGENYGQTLEHENVARGMVVIPGNLASGQLSFDIPLDANPQNMKVMAYIRKEKNSPWTREIIGANRGFKLNEFVNIEDQEQIDIRIYPNPTADLVYINCDRLIESLEVYNELGQMVLEEIPQSNKTEVNFSFLEPGIYVLKTNTAVGSRFDKLVRY